MKDFRLHLESLEVSPHSILYFHESNLESRPYICYRTRQFSSRGKRMPMTDKQRKIRRRQRRVRKLRALKAKLEETQDSRARKKIIEKIRRISPWELLPEK
jgi:hypothetical protein